MSLRGMMFVAMEVLSSTVRYVGQWCSGTFLRLTLLRRGACLVLLLATHLLYCFAADLRSISFATTICPDNEQANARLRRSGKLV